MNPSSSDPTPKPAWVQLYEARRAQPNVEARSPGRPPAPVPRHKVGLTLSQGEIAELERWQERFSELLDRKVSVGETVGILTRIVSGRLALIEAHATPDSLTDLVERLVGEH